MSDLSSRSGLDYNHFRNAICFGDDTQLKQAAIFFDRVVPIRGMSTALGGGVAELAERGMSAEGAKMPAILDSLVYGNDKPTDSWLPFYRFEGQTGRYNEQISLFLDLKKVPYEDRSFRKIPKLLSMYYANNELSDSPFSFRSIFLSLCEGLGIERPALILDNHESKASLGCEIYPTISLLNCELIDTKKASWDQIFELRRDKMALQKLRRLRLFFYENYADKPREFIEDDLATRIEEYDAERRRHGFDALTTVLSTILESDAMVSTVVSGLIAATLGGLPAGIATAVVCQAGKVGLEIARQKQNVLRLRDGHELAYIFHAAEHLRH